MQLVLVRHGESTWNRERRLQGQTPDVPLTDLGRQQARDAARRVAELVPRGTPVLCSDQLRARQTASLVAGALGVTEVATPLLREQALGTLEGRLVDELTAQPVPAGHDISEVAWGGGESVQQVHERCGELLRLAGNRFAGAGHLVLVGHGDALRVLLAVLDGRGHRDVEWRRIDNGEVLVRRWRAG